MKQKYIFDRHELSWFILTHYELQTATLKGKQRGLLFLLFNGILLHNCFFTLPVGVRDSSQTGLVATHLNE